WASAGLVGGDDEGGDDLLVAGVIEVDVQALALHRRHPAVTEFLMEHAVAAAEAAAQRFDARRYHVDEGCGLAAALARALQAGADPRLAPARPAPALSHPAEVAAEGGGRRAIDAAVALHLDVLLGQFVD